MIFIRQHKKAHSVCGMGFDNDSLIALLRCCDIPVVQGCGAQGTLPLASEALARLRLPHGSGRYLSG